MLLLFSFIHRPLGCRRRQDRAGLGLLQLRGWNGKERRRADWFACIVSRSLAGALSQQQWTLGLSGAEVGQRARGACCLRARPSVAGSRAGGKSAESESECGSRPARAAGRAFTSDQLASAQSKQEERKAERITRRPIRCFIFWRRRRL